jgi:SH3 domain protein
MLHYNNKVRILLPLLLSTLSFNVLAEEDAAQPVTETAIISPTVETKTTEAKATKVKTEVKAEVKDMPAKRLWVSDRLEAPLRSCPGDKCRVVKVVRPGNEMTQIGYTADGWAFVSSGDIKGFLPKRYLQDTPVASQQLEGAQRQSLEAVQAQHSLKTEMDTLNNRATSAEGEVGALRKENYELKQELDYVKTVSGQTLMVNEDNRRLKSEVETLRQRNTILEQEAGDVEGKNQRAWFMIGAGVLFIGWLVGRFARSPRRRGWNQI